MFNFDRNITLIAALQACAILLALDFNEASPLSNPFSKKTTSSGASLDLSIGKPGFLNNKNLQLDSVQPSYETYQVMAYSTYLLSKGTETVKTPALTKCLNIKSGNTQQDALVSKAADNERNAYNIIARAAVNYNGAAVAGKSYLDGFLSYDFNDNWRCITTARINGMNILAYDRNVLSNDVKTRAEQHKKFLTQIVSTLAYLNDIGIIHNDIKTENVFVDTTNPKNPAIKLINFGNSIAIQPGANQQILSGAGVQSSLLFDAPEIYACDPSEKQSALRNMASKIGIGKSNSCKPVKYDPRKKDIWSLGVLYYLIFTGKYVLPIPTGQNFRDQYITELRNIYGSENKLNLNFQDYNRADKSTQLDWLFTHIEKYLKNTIQRPTPYAESTAISQESGSAFSFLTKSSSAGSSTNSDSQASTKNSLLSRFGIGNSN